MVPSERKAWVSFYVWYLFSPGDNKRIHNTYMLMAIKIHHIKYLIKKIIIIIIIMRKSGPCYIVLLNSKT